MASEVGYDGHCMVICGDWVCLENGEWKFEIDKNLLSRVVPVKEGLSIRDLEYAVEREFGLESRKVTLSYWPPNSSLFTTGMSTPPVLVTSDVGLHYYVQMVRANKGLNLFVKFEECKKRANSKGDIEQQEDAGLIDSGSRKRGCVSSEGYSSKSGENLLSQPSTAGSKTPILVSSQVSDDFLEDVEELEAKIVGGGCDRGPIVSEVDREEGEEGIRSQSTDDDILGEREGDGSDVVVSPRGYDKEFWGNFIENDYAGSNVVEVMCNTFSCFDHTVILNGGIELKEEKKGNATYAQDSSQERGRCDNPNESAPVKEKRRLEDVDDEEFDIPPLFDDIDYDREEIPDMDVDDDEKGIYKGKVYASKEDCQISLAIHAIKNQFHFKQTTTKRYSFVLTCPFESCDWRIMAHEMKNNGYYEIRKADLIHTCPVESRNQYPKKATSKVIAAVYKAKFSVAGKGVVPLDLQQMLLEDLRVSASYVKCWRAKETAVKDAIGTDEESFGKLEEYLHVLKIANPGTVTDIKTEIDKDGSERFLYMFLAFGASIEGFRKLRRVLVVDGTHLKGKYKGVLLTASGQDANFQVFPLAFAVVDSENDEAWTWFFQKLERIVADSKTLTIISDRHQSIYAAKKSVYPLANHGSCIVHLARNVNARFQNQGLAKLVKNAAYCYKVGEFREIYGQIKSKKSECATYLEKIGLAHWSRVYFQGERYNLMTSNIAESLNKALSKARGSPIVELLKFIRAMLTRWFSARRKKSGKHKGLVPPEVDKEMSKNMLKFKGSKVVSVSSWSYEVVGLFGGKNHVFLDLKQCNCKQYDKLKIPCGHALIAADSIGVPYGTLVADCYRTSTWAATYAGQVNPEASIEDADIPDEIIRRVLFPPKTRRPSGRPRELRIPSVGEYKVLSSGKVKVNRCSRCKGIGHNRARCTKPI